MHDFLRAVGFKNIKDQKELDELLQSIVSSPTNYMSARDSEGNEYAEFTKEFADSMGIIVRGEFTDHDNFRIEYYIPYFYGPWNYFTGTDRSTKACRKRILCRNL